MVFTPPACSGRDDKKVVPDAVRVDCGEGIVAGLLDSLQQLDGAGIVGEPAHAALVALRAVRQRVFVGGGYVKVFLAREQAT